MIVLKKVSYEGCKIQGSHTGCGTITGEIGDNLSDFVFIDGKPLALQDSITIKEQDGCCVNKKGKVSEGSSLVYNEGRPIARIDDKVKPHSGTAKVIEGSDFVFDEG